jgi:sialate O-acetylesterase
MSWGWIAVDYIRFVGGDGKQVSKVNLSLSTTDSAAYDIPVTLTALADDSAEYKFMVRKSGEEWKDINSYSTSNSCIWVPGQPGDYEVKVYARGSETKVDKQAEATVTYKALESYVNKPLVSQMFGNDMVLQRNEENTIYGWDKPGSTITIKLGMKKNFQTYTGVADANGEWKVEIGNHRAGGPYTITVKGSSDKVKLENVLFGDVYLCSGQSNMAFMLAAAENGDKEIEKSNYPNIRYIKIPETTSAVPVKTMNSTAVWQVCSADTSRQLSAVAYFYARKLNKDLKVPIGIVFSAVGGTKAESWTSYDSLKNLPDYADEATKITTGAKDIQIASSPVALYNAMIAPVAPFKLKGVLWYQGESNWGEKAYNVLLPTLIADWRKHFNDSDLPFIIIQITAYGQVQTDASPVQSGTGLPEIREAQLKTMLNDKNVGLVTICDLGDPENIHPTDKQDVGARAAICAEGIIYGKNIVYSGPIYDSMAIDGNKITISFTSTGSGLIVGSKDGLKSVKVVKNGKLTGFAIAGADGVFYSADAVISGDKVIVSSSKVTNPVAVRYGWYDSPVINLYNKDGLIASPFRTDVN